MNWHCRFCLVALLAACCRLRAGTVYVSPLSSIPTAPYTNWTSAAHVIQDAIDAAQAGDEIVVSNGVYATGGRPTGTNSIPNRVALDKPLTLRSLNGPQFTTIVGHKITGGYLGCGAGAIRCAFLGDGAVLTGFTLTNGATLSDSNAVPDLNGGGVCCESTSGVVSNCVMVGNGAWHGGGVYEGTLYDCTVTNNAARYEGGGALESAAFRSFFVRNSARLDEGGGAYGGTLDSCIVTNNLAQTYGGGVSSASLVQCTLAGNLASSGGGGAAFAELQSCTIASNSALFLGGGIYGCTGSECLVYGNSCGNSGGGADESMLTNCVLFANIAMGTSQWEGGGGAYDSRLVNCTLSNNLAWGLGGGAGANLNVDFGMTANLTNCVVVANFAQDGGGLSGCLADRCFVGGNLATNSGGGAEAGTLNNCLVTGNAAGTSAGGAFGSSLANCTVAANTAPSFGGVQFGWCWNSIIFSNSGSVKSNQWDQTTFNFSCTLPMPTNGVGNLTNAPLFRNAGAGDFHLLPGSPCIDAGTNLYARSALDLEGQPRIFAGTVDMGTYESQAPGVRVLHDWLASFGLPGNGSADFIDSDGDGLSNWQEWLCRTDPTDPTSALRMLSAQPSGTNVLVSWQSVAGVNYFLERSDATARPFSFAAVGSNLPGQAGFTSFLDTNSATASNSFYRVGIIIP